jgi:Tol biopolymer transport system component
VSRLRFGRALLPSGLALILAVASGGCLGTSLSRSEIAETPIALLYWSAEEGRRRLEMLGMTDNGKTPFHRREGVADLGRIKDLTGTGTLGNADIRYPGRVVLLNPRTLEISEVPQAPQGARPLSWSEGHEKLMISTNRVDGTHRLYEIEIETGEMRSVTGRRKNYIAGAFGPDRSVAYASVDLNGQGVPEGIIWAGDGRSRAVPIAEGVLARHVDYAPDGSSIVYVPRPMGPTQRHIVQTQAPTPGSLPSVVGPGEEPVYSPDSQWIVYAAPTGLRGARSRLLRARADGSGRTTIGRAVRSEKSPAVSPDGNFVIYVSEHNGLDRLFVKRFDGSGDRLLFDDGAVAWPVW